MECVKPHNTHTRDAKISIFCSKKVKPGSRINEEKRSCLSLTGYLKFLFVYLYVENNNNILQVFVNCEFVIIYSSQFSENNPSENDLSESLKYTCVSKI